MSIIDWVRSRKRSADTVTTISAQPAESDFIALMQAKKTYTVTTQTALEIPAFSASVDFITATVASLPIRLYREDSEGKNTQEVMCDNRVSLLNDETGDLLTAFDAKKALVSDMLVYGAGYMYIDHRHNDVDSLHYVEHGNVSVLIGTDPIYKTAQLVVGGRQYYPWDFVILARNTKNGVTGCGLVQEHKVLMSAAYEELTYEQILAGSGGNKKGFLQSETRLSDFAMDKIKEAWNELYSKKESSAMVLNGGLKFEQASNTSMEMQLNQNKQTNAAQIATMFGLNPDVISGKASAEAIISAVKTAVEPIVHGLEAALNASLLLESEKPTMYFVVDLDAMNKSDMLQRFQAYEIALRNNILQLDEIRYKEDLAPLGLNYMKIGLDSVLLDPSTGMIYTPNTNQLVRMPTTEAATSEALTDSTESVILEERGQKFDENEHPRDESGEFTSKGGGSPSAGDKNSKSKPTKEDRQNAEKYGKELSGTKTVTGVKMTRVVPHAAQRMRERGINLEGVKDVLTTASISYPGNTAGTTCVQKNGWRAVYSDDGALISIIDLDD